jgi:hypothetical protein
MCRFAIAGATDRGLRRRLKRVLHFLELQDKQASAGRRRTRAVAWRSLAAR